MRLNLYSLAYPVRSLGPGRRAAIWTAGCGRGCPGCIGPEMHRPESGRSVLVKTIALRLFSLNLGLTGLTVSGGEPADQAPVVAALLETVRTHRPEWDVIMYTGYSLDELAALSKAAAELPGLCDVLVDGPYRRDVPSDHPLAGSGNQAVHYLTPRARADRRLYERPQSGGFELGLGPNEFAMLVGVGDSAGRHRVSRTLGANVMENEERIR